MLVASSWLPGGAALYHSMAAFVQGKAAIVNTILKTAGIHKFLYSGLGLCLSCPSCAIGH